MFPSIALSQVFPIPSHEPGVPIIRAVFSNRSSFSSEATRATAEVKGPSPTLFEADTL